MNIFAGADAFTLVDGLRSSAANMAKLGKVNRRLSLLAQVVGYKLSCCVFMFALWQPH